MLLRQGAHPKVVQERLGNANVGITLDVYSHVMPGMQSDAAVKIDAGMRKALAGWVGDGATVRPTGYDARMTIEPDTERIIAAATAVLPEIVAALDPKEQPVGGSWVAVTINGRPTDAVSKSPVIHRCWYTWRHDAPLEPLDEAMYMELTRDVKTDVIKVPVWAFDLTPVADDEWRLGYWFGAPLRMWMGEKAGDRVMGHGLGYLARRTDGGWELKFEDILAS